MFKLSISIKIACILLVGCIHSSFVEASNSGESDRVELCISADPNKKATPSIRVPRPFWQPSWMSWTWTETKCPNGEMKRSAIVYVPNGLEEGANVPLVMNIHALGANANLQQIFTGFDKTADDNKFIVVYPEGFSKAKIGTPLPAPPGVPLYSFNAGGCCSDKPIDDIGFLRKLIEYMEDNYSIDSERIYAMGMSNGGFMTNRVACEMSDIIAAAAPVAGVLFESYSLETPHPMGWTKADDFVCAPENRIPILHTHNKMDSIVPFDGSSGVLSFGFPSVSESIEKWRKLNNVKDTGKVDKKNSITECTLYSEPVEGKGDDFATVELCVIDSDEAGGHCWPGQAGQGAFLQCLNDDVDNSYIWQFFTKHKRDERKAKAEFFTIKRDEERKAKAGKAE
eukprot:scaffold9055_cov136-Skeletonema_dohrnii-CCMP3373.AAC.3